MNAKLKLGALVLISSVMAGCASNSPNRAVVERLEQLTHVCPGCAQSLKFIGEMEETHCDIPFEEDRIEKIAKTSEFYAFSMALRTLLPAEKFETVLRVASEEVDCDQPKWIANTRNRLEEIMLGQ